ncbi:MAG: sugar kinase [Ferruginibacter sp.]
MNKIVTFGEVLLRLSPPDHLRFTQATSFNLNYGGAEFNTCISLSLLGMPVSFVTRIPQNDLSNCLVQELNKYGVNSSNIIYGGKRLGVYYLESGAVLRGSKVIYDREHSSMAEIKPGIIDWHKVLKEAGWFHFTGITPAISQAAADETLMAVETAAALKIPVSIDLNYRAKLWQYGKSPSEIMPGLLNNCTIVLGDLNTVETYFGIEAEGNNETEKYLSAMMQLKNKFPNLQTIIFSYRGSINASHNTIGAYLYDGKDIIKSAEYDMSNMVDRLGGGDALMAGFIYGLNNYSSKADALNFAVAASALKSSIHGDTNYVSKEEVIEIMRGNTFGRISR